MGSDRSLDAEQWACWPLVQSFFWVVGGGRWSGWGLGRRREQRACAAEASVSSEDAGNPIRMLSFLLNVV